MQTNRPKTTISKTLLILLGIVLAFILTINAKAEPLSPKQVIPTNAVESNVSQNLFEKIAHSSLRSLVEKASSLN